MHTYTNGEWGKMPTTLDDAKGIDDLYLRLATIGFGSYNELICRTGDARLYYRSIAAGKKMFQFDYCCVLPISGYFRAVLLQDLPDVCQFMKEIDAQPKKREVVLRIANIVELKSILQQVVTELKEIKTGVTSVQIVSSNSSSQQTDETLLDLEDLHLPLEGNNVQHSALR